MLERYYLKPTTVDEIRSSWLADPIEKYVSWMEGRGCSDRTIFRRVPLIRRFGQFSWNRGTRDLRQLKKQIDPFVNSLGRSSGHSGLQLHNYKRDIRHPIQQMLRVVALDKSIEIKWQPFATQAPKYFLYLIQERGLSASTINLYMSHLKAFEQYLLRNRMRRLGKIAPAVIDNFITEQSKSLCAASLRGVCSALRSFFKYCFREELISSDLSEMIEGPRTYQLATIPRSLPWNQVLRVIQSVDRRSSIGKRDYAILLLLGIYGLRGREVASLKLDDIDWQSNTLHIRCRKVGNSSSYPLSAEVGEAIIDYLKSGRAKSTYRYLFLGSRAPRGPIGARIVSLQARARLKAAGINGMPLGSHTFRHSVAQRLVDSNYSLKTIGDYLGHRSPVSTQIYGKISVEALRELAVSGEREILQ